MPMRYCSENGSQALLGAFTGSLSKQTMFWTMNWTDSPTSGASIAGHGVREPTTSPMPATVTAVALRLTKLPQTTGKPPIW